MINSDHILQEHLSVLSGEFESQLHNRVRNLKACWDEAKFGHSDSADITALKDTVHGIATTAIAFSFIPIADAARNLEQFLASFQLIKGPMLKSHCQQIEQLLYLLEAAVSNKHDIGKKSEQGRWEPKSRSPDIDAVGPLIFILECNNNIAEQISIPLQQEGYQVNVYKSVRKLEQAILSNHPSAIITDMQHLPEKEPIAAGFAPDIKNRNFAGVPLIFISSNDDIDTHLNAVRAGADSYFTMPLDINRLITSLKTLISSVPMDPYRIMIIDDDQTMSYFCASILEQEGMTVTVILNPANMLDVINKSRPELVLINLSMTSCAAMELTTIIRQREEYAGLAIVFLASGVSIESRLAAINRGGDDIITIPVNPDYLIATVSSRVSRARALNTMNYKLESTLHELENQHFALDQHAIVSITNINGAIIYVNDKFCDITGYSKSELIGKDHHILKSGIHSHELYADMWSKISKGNVWQGEICNKKKNGDFYWVKVTIVPFMDEEMRPYQFVSINSDITSRINAEQDLLKARDIAVHANKAKSDFLSKMSHELRTPLNAIMGFSELLASSKQSANHDTYTQYAKEIHNAGGHLLNLINEVLDLSRIEADQIKVEAINVPLEQFLDECTSLIMPLVRKKKISILKNYNNDLWIESDPVRLKQVIVNLLSNAVKYNKQLGSVEIKTYAESDEKVIIEVIDSGKGIKQDQTDKLFQPFCRLPQHKKEEGAGIGLALSKRLIELMDSEIGVDTEYQGGTRFWLKVKRVDNGSQRQLATSNHLQVSESEVDLSDMAPCTMLYIEDNLTNYNLVKEILAEIPQIKLLHATTIKTGLKLTRMDKPDIILMDLQLPDTNGFDGIKVIRKQKGCKNIPAIAISALANDESIQRAKQEGFEKYITKPVKIHDFLSTISEITTRNGIIKH